MGRNKMIVWKWCPKLSILMLMLVIMVSQVLCLPSAEAAGLGFRWFLPESALLSEDESSVKYQVYEAIDPSNVHFQWNFSNGMDANFGNNVEQITLTEKNSGETVQLDKGKPEDYVLDTNGIIQAGDFKYTKLGGGDGSGGELRLMELIIKSRSLKPGTTYVIKLAPGLKANNGNTPDKTYFWEFTASGQADTTAPTWPQGSAINVSNVMLTGLTLDWSAATDEVGVTNYKIYQDGVEIAGVDGNTNTYNVTGLTMGTQYTFKVEAGDVSGNWSTDGPTVTISTLADNEAPVWPENATLDCTDVTYSSLKLAWPTATDNVGVSGYKLFYGEEVLTLGPDTLSYCLTGLKSNTEYTFRIEAGDESGNWNSGLSHTVTTAVNPTQGAGFDFVMSDPVSVNVSVEDTLVYNRVQNLLDPQNVRLCWLFSKKLDEAACRQNLSLKNKSTGETITLAEDDLVFSYEGEQCCLELRLGSTTLQQSTDYVVELGSNFAADDGILLGKTYSWEFATWPQKKIQARLAAGATYTLVLRDDGTMFSCGNNNWGKLGDGTSSHRKVPVPVKDLSGVISVSAGNDHSVALKEDGTVWTWGRNYYKQLGYDGSESRIPAQVPGISGAVGVVARTNYTAVLKNDGTVWTFGQNNYGQLGDGTKTDRLTPMQVPGLKDATILACGGMNMMAVKADGSLWTWGWNRYGQLGDGTTIDNPNPVKIMDGVIDIAAGHNHAVALKNDGTLWAWGENTCGQLGNGSTENSSVPVKIEKAPDRIKSIKAGLRFTVIYTEDGTVWTCGSNKNGQLGRDNGGSSESLLARVEGLTDIAAIATGQDHVLFMKNNGEVWGCGNNFERQLGNGDEKVLNQPSLVRMLLVSDSSPTLVQATATGEDAIITLEFNKAMADPAGNLEVFNVKVNGNNNLVTAAALGEDPTKIVLTLTTPINKGDQVIISYTMGSVVVDNKYYIHGTVVAADGDVLASFTNQPVTVPLLTAPVLTPNTTDNTVGQVIDITFTDDAAWRADISGVTVNGTALEAEQYTVIEGNISIAADVFKAVGDYTIMVSAAGYTEVTVIQQIIKPVYIVNPNIDTVYENGTTPDGIVTMTVKEDMDGFRYFSVTITPVHKHSGEETVVFVHLSDGMQAALNASRADFDLIKSAQAGFNVKAGDVVKGYLVDELTNDPDFNPTILQGIQ